MKKMRNYQKIYRNYLEDLKRGNKLDSIKYLNKTIKVKIDRQMRSHHPKRNFIYPVNYGFVPN